MTEFMSFCDGRWIRIENITSFKLNKTLQQLCISAGDRSYVITGDGYKADYARLCAMFDVTKKPLVYDPRLREKVHSSNPALAIRELVAKSDVEVNDILFSKLADICDEVIQ